MSTGSKCRLAALALIGISACVRPAHESQPAEEPTQQVAPETAAEIDGVVDPQTN